MPGIAVMAATVVLVVGFFKVLAAKINVVIEGVWAVVAAVLACVGVWGYHVVTTSTSVDAAVLFILLELIVTAVIGYKFLPDSVKDFDLKNLRGTILNNK